MNNSQTISQLDLDYFNKFEKGYFPYSESDVSMMIETLKKHIMHFKEPKICEMGCGSGQFSSRLEKAIHSIKPEFYGVDIAKTILDFYPFNKIHGSAFNLPVDPDFFDVVCYPAALHHLYPFEDAIRELSRILKPGGIMFCLEPNFFHPHRRFFMRFGNLYRSIKKVNDVPINPKRLQVLLASFQFEYKEIKFVNIDFDNQGVLQYLQNLAAKSVLAKIFPKIILPWFITIAQKK